jgi:hypothetical protein
VQNSVLAVDRVHPDLRQNIGPLSRRHAREYLQLFPNLNQHCVQGLVQTGRKYLTGEPPFEDFLPATQLHERLQGIGGFCRDCHWYFVGARPLRVVVRRMN